MALLFVHVAIGNCLLLGLAAMQLVGDNCSFDCWLFSNAYLIASEISMHELKRKNIYLSSIIII